MAEGETIAELIKRLCSEGGHLGTWAGCKVNNPTLSGGDLMVTNRSEQPSFRWWGTLAIKSKRNNRKLKQVYEELGKEEEKENCQWFDRETGLTGGLPAIPLPSHHHPENIATIKYHHQL